jgi:hypothetical protein
MVMPALLGGFLRRDVNNVYYQYVLVNQKKAGIIGAARSNEAVLLGPRIRGKQQVGKKVVITRFSSKEVSKGLMKMNLRMKIGSPRAHPADRGGCAIRKLTIRNRSQRIDSLHHTKTEGNLRKLTLSSDTFCPVNKGSTYKTRCDKIKTKQTRSNLWVKTRNKKSTKIGKPFSFLGKPAKPAKQCCLERSNHVFEQHGNLVKRYDTLISKAFSPTNWSGKNSKIKKLNLRGCYKQRFSHSSAFKISLSRPDGSNGGKIAEKANASSNVLDKVKKKKVQRYGQQSLFTLTNLPNLEFVSKLNSVLHHKFTQLCYNFLVTKVRYYASQNLSTLFGLPIRWPLLAGSKRLEEDQNTIGNRVCNKILLKQEPLNWPKEVEIKDIELRVYNKQIELCKIAKIQGVHSAQVKRLQDIMIRSLDSRIVAVAKVGQGSKINNKEYKMAMVSRLKNAQGLKLLGGAVIGRAALNLIKLVLEPLVEMKSDNHSYGFRKYRSAKNAIAIARAQLRTGAEMEKKWILNANIEGFFHNINHQWLLDNVPLPAKYKQLFEQWLKIGNVYYNKYQNFFYHTDYPMMTPNPSLPNKLSEIMPSILVNFSLDGLETTIYGSLKSLTKSKELRFMVKTKTGSKRLSSKLFTVRFANNLVLTARSKNLIVKYVIPAIKEFLKERGLKFTKTELFTLSDEKSQLNFLGYVFKYNSHWKPKKPFVFKHSGESAIAVYPSREKVKEVNKKLKKIISKSQNLTAYSLISKLNPIIRVWSNYFNIGNCSRYRDYVRQGLYRNTWSWCKKKHNRWGKKLIAKRYFLTQKDNKDHEESISSPNFGLCSQTRRGKRKEKEGVENKIKKRNLVSFKGRLWTFRGIANSLSRYSESKKKIIYLQDPSNTCAVLASKHYIIPKKLQNVHAFSSDYIKLIDFQVSINLKSEGPRGTLKQKLLKRDNLCCGCKKIITPMDIINGCIHIHHVKPIAKKGSKSNINNLTLMHSWCHRNYDHNTPNNYPDF